jgi:hypothetical protein
MSYVEDQLKAKAELYAERNKLYGDNYKTFGAIMRLLLGDVALSSDDDFRRFGVLVQVVSKITRYAERFADGGHPDSLDDTAVYAMMLKELDEEAAARRPQAAVPNIKADFSFKAPKPPRPVHFLDEVLDETASEYKGTKPKSSLSEHDVIREEERTCDNCGVGRNYSQSAPCATCDGPTAMRTRWTKRS